MGKSTKAAAAAKESEGDYSSDPEQELDPVLQRALDKMKKQLEEKLAAQQKENGKQLEEKLAAQQKENGILKELIDTVQKENGILKEQVKGLHEGLAAQARTSMPNVLREQVMKEQRETLQVNVLEDLTKDPIAEDSMAVTKAVDQVPVPKELLDEVCVQEDSDKSVFQQCERISLTEDLLLEAGAMVKDQPVLQALKVCEQEVLVEDDGNNTEFEHISAVHFFLRGAFEGAAEEMCVLLVDVSAVPKKPPDPGTEVFCTHVCTQDLRIPVCSQGG